MVSWTDLTQKCSVRPDLSLFPLFVYLHTIDPVKMSVSRIINDRNLISVELPTHYWSTEACKSVPRKLRAWMSALTSPLAACVTVLHGLRQASYAPSAWQRGAGSGANAPDLNTEESIGSLYRFSPAHS